jgi:hypothetical protein
VERKKYRRLGDIRENARRKNIGEKIKAQGKKERRGVG